MPGYIQQGATPRDTIANISEALTPEKGGARSLANTRYANREADVIQRSRDPYVSVPSLNNQDIPLSEALQGYKDARLAVAQGAPTSGIQSGAGNKIAVVDANRIMQEINESLKNRMMGRYAGELTEASAQERRALGTQELYTGMTKQGQQYKPLEPGGKLDMQALQQSLRKAVNDGRFTAQEADNIFRSAVRRDAPGMDTTDMPGSLNLPFFRLNPGGKMGMSVGEPQLRGLMNMPRVIGSPDRLRELTSPANPAYNPISVLLGQLLQPR
jgi:hypothetical protein